MSILGMFNFTSPGNNPGIMLLKQHIWELPGDII